MARTYLPRLLYLVHVLAVYLARNNAKIRSHLTGNELIAYDAMYNCINAFDALREVLTDFES